MTRWKAAGIHMAIGLVLIATIIGSIFYFWFPHALYRIAGLNQLFVTMLCVDLVAGPMLTCIVYKASDKRTKWDLTVIGVLQATFLGYALHTAWITRPVFLIWSVDHMVLLFANEIEPDDLARGSTPRASSLPWFGPRRFAVTLPKDPKSKETIFKALIREATSIERLPEHYGPYESEREQILFWASAIGKAAVPAQARDPRLTTAIEATGRREDALKLVSIESSRDASDLLIDAASAEPLAVLPPGVAHGVGNHKAD